jgi:Family of unknown function (DUF6572)
VVLTASKHGVYASDIVRKPYRRRAVPNMAIDNAGVVDFISIDPTTDKVMLTIADHLEWDENTDEHTRLLREKLSTYVEFIESGELLEKYPKAKGREVIVNVVGKYPLNEEASAFYQQTSSAMERMGAKLRFQLGVSSEDDEAS